MDDWIRESLFLPFLIGDYQEDGCGPDPEILRHDIDCGGFHFGCQAAHAEPCVPFRVQFSFRRHFGWFVLTVERIFGLYDSCMEPDVSAAGGFCQRSCEFKVGYGRVGDRGVFPAGTFRPDRGGGNDEIASEDVFLHAAAGTDPDKGVGSGSYQFFDSDGGRRAADPGGGNADTFSVQCAGICAVFSVFCDFFRLVEMRGDQCASSGVPGKQDVFSDFTVSDSDMVLHVFFCVFHLYVSPCFGELNNSSCSFDDCSIFFLTVV